MEYTEELLKKITLLGMLGYHINKIINVLDIEDIDKKDFTKVFNDHQSIIRKAYQKGIDKADFAIDQKLFEMVKAGDLKALEIYAEKKWANAEIQKDLEE